MALLTCMIGYTQLAITNLVILCKKLVRKKSVFDTKTRTVTRRKNKSINLFCIKKFGKNVVQKWYELIFFFKTVLISPNQF